jgi:IS30 family transposase
MEDAMAKFFTYEERLMLQRLSKEGMSFKKIAAQIHKDPATISREVRKYAVEIVTGKPGYSFNACKNRNSYKRKKPNDRSPYETFSFHYGEEVLRLLGCTPVATEDILLKLSLLKK